MSEVATSRGAPPGELAFRAPPSVLAALGELGRTEDVRLSPRGHRLALACFHAGQIALADIELGRTAAGVDISLPRMELLDCDALQQPHGLDFLDEDTLVVGNRGGGIAVVRLPAPGTNGPLTLIGELAGPAGLDAPGSVAVRRLPDGGAEVLACHNWANALTRYAVSPDGRAAADGHVVARSRLDLPDGLSVSDDGRWLAVSNHNTHDVLVYELDVLDVDTDPVAVLRGVHYPHGLRFDASGRRLLVADAGAPFVDVFRSENGVWAGAAYPVASIRALDDETFARGHNSPQEGGPKGIDVDPRTNVLVMTCETAPLRFFDLDAVLESATARPPSELLRYELARLSEADLLRARAEESHAHLVELTATKAWRLTSPLRRANAAARRLAGRRR